ncbi:mevalonate kinase-like protein [Cokeromyces recurvatus]|uniref:mevalonate kinase-like protein n=1 Tax=Cokeromyces recurvatus TaxID=90255 RepID=UPI00221F493A|nr:mevalonate kinase-like protein [Cokeromyces recurvatus]KAI7905455.1 mevalonate kinase-like protein [Cokeromyces recurvatus]
MTVTEMNERILVSAPGKVILFGEHSVVYQKTAVAASLGLRSYLYLEKRKDNVVQLILPDVNINKAWTLNEFPFRYNYPDSDTRHPNNMPIELREKIDQLSGFSGKETDAKTQALTAFLYLLIILESKAKEPLTHGFTVCVRSFLPVGAGLGSSASFSVAIVTALLILNKMIPVDFNTSKSNDTASYLDLINRYAFKAEEVIHGNPSGVDNAVATFGGAKTFMRGQGFTTLEGFYSLRLLLTNTKVPRSTNALVAGVGEKRKKYPEVIEPMLDSMHQIAIHCRDAFKQLKKGELTKEGLMDQLEDLVTLNHCLLDGLGVSHPSLEKVREITAQFGLKTKLTGAGGGGCSVTFIRDSVSQSLINEVMLKLRNEGFDCYQTSVGGIGADAVTLLQNETYQWLLEADRETLEHYFTK